MKTLASIPASSLSPKANEIIFYWLTGVWTLEEQLAEEPNGAEIQQELLQTGAFWLEEGKLQVKLFDDETSEVQT